ncbi:MAG TPA: GTP 3',8-cyclase MoaA, partial [Dehalococcoidia bacterium]|nr:GTP 3',8-cyclase MoaA [Dehalococcoidia bacterium]
AAGMGPIKINAVVQKGVNDHTISEIARHFQGSGHIVRFIEFMDVGTTNGWKLDQVISGQQIIETIHAALPLEPIASAYQGEVAQRWRYQDGSGEIGVITSVTQTFCGDCTRARLSADGKLYTCLFASSGEGLRGPLRAGVSDAALATNLQQLWSRREDRYSERRSDATAGLPKVEMSFIGG